MTDQPEQQRPDIEKVLGTDRSQGRRWLSARRLALVVVALIALATAGYALSLWGSPASDARFITAPVTQQDMTVMVNATGSLQPTNVVDISSELSGTIRKVHVDYNSRVVAGQELAELDTDKLEAEVDSKRARLAAAKARVTDAEATMVEKELEYARKRQLAVRQVVSQHDLEVAKAAFERATAAVESAKADVRAAEAELKLSETNLSKACICSPIDGTVLARNVDPGQTVATSLQAPVLFTIAEDLTEMEVQVDVDEADVGQVREGQNATFTVDAYPGRTFSAQISALRYGSETVQGVVTYKAVLSTENPGLLLRPGMTATADIVVQQLDNVLVIPNEALRYVPKQAGKGDKRSFIRRLLPGPPSRNRRPPSERTATGPQRTIWVLGGDGPKAVQVTIGPTDGRRTQIADGDVKPGQKVIVDTQTASARER